MKRNPGEPDLIFLPGVFLLKVVSEAGAGKLNWRLGKVYE